MARFNNRFNLFNRLKDLKKKLIIAVRLCTTLMFFERHST